MTTLLSNRLATFTFDSDGATGLRLTSFRSAAGSKTWLNSDARLWQAKVFDTTGVVSTVLTAIAPTFLQFSQAPIKRDATGQELVLRWTAIPMPAGTDKLDVTLTLRLNDTEDWLRARISAAWNGAATRFALDSIAPLPLSMAPHNRGRDAAIVPVIEGILSRDPLSFMRDQFERDYPSFIGWSMAVWGYYETLTKQAWMLWLDDNQLETIRSQWQSDGVNLLWSPLQYQPDNLLAGNGGKVLGSLFTWCLRPLAIRTRHGWKDIGKFYRQRLEANPQSWFVPTRTKRLDLSAQEKKFTIFADFAANDSTHNAGQPGLSDALMATVRTRSLAPPSTPILLLCEGGVGDPDYYGIELVNEADRGSFRAQLQSCYVNQNCFPVSWLGGSPYPAGGKPSEKRWFNESGGGVDSNDLRWWTTNDLLGALHMSRNGVLSGGGVDRLGEYLTGLFYRERVYPVTAWTPGTKTVGVTGAPSGDGFGAALLGAIIIPASGAARLGIARVLLLGASSVQVTANFLDGTGAVVTPAPGDTLHVFNNDVDVNLFCVHARVNSTDHMRQLKRNTSKGMALKFRASGLYFDTWGPPLSRLGLDFQQFCYRDHATWSKINGGYVQHPKGGGNWYVQACKTLAAQVKQAGRDAQVSLGGPSFFWMTSEGTSEVMFQEFDMNFHRCGSGGLYVTNPVPLKLLAAPLMSVVYPGRFFSRGLNQELSSGALNTFAPFNDPLLHKIMGYWLAYEWPYGAVMPTLSYFEDDGVPVKDFFDDTQYVSGGGTVSNQVKATRDLWVQITQAETNWLCAAGFRYGEFLGVGELDPTETDVTTGMAETTFANIYSSYDVIEERATTPRVVHGMWKADDGTVLVVMANWTDTAGKWSARLDTEDAGLGAPATNLLRAVGVTRFNSAHAPQADVDFDPETGKLSIESLAAYSVAVVVIVPADLGDVPGDPRCGRCDADGFEV